MSVLKFKFIPTSNPCKNNYFITGRNMIIEMLKRESNFYWMLVVKVLVYYKQFQAG